MHNRKIAPSRPPYLHQEVVVIYFIHSVHFVRVSLITLYVKMRRRTEAQAVNNEPVKEERKVSLRTCFSCRLFTELTLADRL